MGTVLIFIYLFSAAFVLVGQIAQMTAANRPHPEQGASPGDVFSILFWSFTPVLNTAMAFSFLNLLRKKINNL